MPRSFLMKVRIWLIPAAVALLAAAVWINLMEPQATSAAPEATLYASPLNASCTLATRSTCKIHLEPFTINKSSGPQLLGFQVYANSTMIYDFKTDVSNPPFTSSYTPSRVKQDFAATCSRTYDIFVIARDSDDPNYYVLGGVQDVVCPQGIYDAYLPVINR